MLSEIQIGKSRGAAFSSLAARTTVPEAKTFVSALVQADRLGLPIGNVLREQSNQMRLVRRQRAEEKAQKVPVKILFPMLLCIFPALFIVIIGPGAIRIDGHLRAACELNAASRHDRRTRATGEGPSACGASAAYPVAVRVCRVVPVSAARGPPTRPSPARAAART